MTEACATGVAALLLSVVAVWVDATTTTPSAHTTTTTLLAPHTLLLSIATLLAPLTLYAPHHLPSLWVSCLLSTPPFSLPRRP